MAKLIKIDRDFFHTTPGQTGPMQACAQTFCTAGGPAFAALVIGAFGEWSDGLESFVRDLASMGARALQARMGAPSAAQARSTLLWKMRQEIGMCALRGHAKVIIARARLERTGTGTGNGGGTRTDSDDDGNPDEWAESAYHLRREKRFGIGAQVCRLGDYMPPGGGNRPRLVAAAEALPLLHALAGDPLRAILKLLGGADLADFRDHSSPAQEMMRRSGFLRTRSLTVFACECMPDLLVAVWRMPLLAASVGCVGALEELVDNRQCELTVLRYANEHGCLWDSSTCYHAAAYGHLEALRQTCEKAAEGGQLEALRYAHEHGCPWDGHTCWRAAQGGHLEVLRYAHEHGCPFYFKVCLSVALEYGHAEVVAYLRAAQPAT
ncbi:hypothetical protein T492DRAFT_871728 [Pavlovales sp. CCMP2436]|nr:hypothetical protein T492DRAFT_871728 [Pavlovales sp. CCMP2436]